jgi:hypothetical protein
MHVKHLRFSTVRCRHCDNPLPVEWEVVALEAVIPRFINGQVDLEQKWLDEHGVPVIPDAVFSAAEPDTILEGLDELTQEEQEWIENGGDFAPMEDCWQEIVSALEDLVPDEPPSDHPLSCDFCHQDLTFNEPAIRIRHCIVAHNPRGRGSFKLEPAAGYSDFIMCLSCGYTMSREVIPAINGQDLWPTL